MTTSYLYDGLGRVRRVSIDGVPKMDYYYDAKGKVISELANPTTGGTPVYFLGHGATSRRTMSKSKTTQNS